MSHLGFDMSALDKQVEEFVVNLPSPRSKHGDEDEDADAEGAEEDQAKTTEETLDDEGERRDVSGLFGDATTTAFDNLPQPVV